MRVTRRVAGLLLAWGMGGCATGEAPSGALSSPDPIPIEIQAPEGPGPFPAVVLLHDCSGLGPRSGGAPRRWARELVQQGYVVALPDSFGPRGFPDGVCTNPSPNRADVAPARRVRDAYAALDKLRSLPRVDRDRVGVMGGSHGGSSTLATIAMIPQDDAALRERKGHGFAAAIAFYPGCAIGRPAFNNEFHAAVPLLILTGERDDWTPAAPCLQLVEAAKRSGGDVAIKVYPGAHHAFDSASPVRYVGTRINGNAPGGRGATTGGDPAAWADSKEQVKAFFAAHLKRAP